MPPKDPSNLRLAYLNESIEGVRAGDANLKVTKLTTLKEMAIDYETDVDQVLAGVQNSTLVDHIPRRPTSPDVVLLLIPGDGTRFDRVKFTPFDLQHTLTTSGGVDPVATIFNVPNPVGASDLVVDALRPTDLWIKGEIVRLLTITADNPSPGTTKLTVERGVLGTTAITHAENSVIRRLELSLEKGWGIYNLTGEQPALPQITGLSALSLVDRIHAKWDSPVDDLWTDDQKQQLRRFVLFASSVQDEGGDPASWPIKNVGTLTTRSSSDPRPRVFSMSVPSTGSASGPKTVPDRSELCQMRSRRRSSGPRVQARDHRPSRRSSA